MLPSKIFFLKKISLEKCFNYNLFNFKLKCLSTLITRVISVTLPIASCLCVNAAYAQENNALTSLLPFASNIAYLDGNNAYSSQAVALQANQNDYLSAQADFTQEANPFFDWMPLTPSINNPNINPNNHPNRANTEPSQPNSSPATQQARCDEAAPLPRAQYDAAYRIFSQHGNLAAAQNVAEKALSNQPSSLLWQNRLRDTKNHIQGIQTGAVINQQNFALSPHNLTDFENSNSIGDACASLKDYPYGGIRAALGYSSNDGPFISGQYRHQNFLGRAWQWQLDGTVAQKRQSIATQLELPANDQAWRYRFHASHRRSRLENHRIDSSQFAVLRLRQIGAYSYHFGLRYYFDSLNLDNKMKWRARSLAPTVGWQYQNLDRTIYPRQGITLNLRADAGLKNVLSTQNFIRTHGRATHYFKLGKKNVALLRGEAGAVIARGDARQVPASLLFYGGGVDSLRGANYQELGNREGEVIYPAKYLTTVGAEWQSWFRHNFAVAVFYDAGFVTSNWQQRQFNHGVGPGIRWQTPIGAVNADVAYNIREKKWRPYLSFGATF